VGRRRNGEKFSFRQDKRMSVKKIIIAGFGGQGIIFTGRVISTAALIENKHVSMIPCYGAEMRGGTAYCVVSISDSQINSLYADYVDYMMIMNEPSLIRFIKRAAKKAVVVANSSLIKNKIKSKNAKIVYKPFSELAAIQGRVKVANMFALGVLIKCTGIVKVKSVLNALQELSKNEESFNLNRLSLNKGIKLIKA